MPKDPLLEARRILKKRGKKSSELFSKKKIEEYQRFWRKAGPKRFAEEVLTCPLDVPKHPDFNREEWENEEPHLCKGCTMSQGKEVYHKKFRNNGVPYHIILSEEQIEYLSDLAGDRIEESPFWTNGVMQSLIAAARGCLAGETKVQMFDGTIKELKDIQIDDEVVSFDKKTNSLVKGKVINAEWHGIDIVWKLGGSKEKSNSVFITDEHPILDSKKEFRKAVNFERDKYRNRKNKSIFIEEFDTKKELISDEKIKLLALLISEGHYTKNQTPKITNSNLDLLNEMKTIIRKEFNDLNPKFYKKGGNGWDLVLSRDYNDTRPKNGKRGSQSSKFVKWLDGIGILGQVKETKCLPKIIFESSNRQIRLFLKYFILGDGNKDIRIDKRIGRTKKTTSMSLYAGLSLKLAKDLSNLLMRLGIYSIIKRRDRPNPAYTVKFYQKWKLERLTIPTETIYSQQKTGFYDEEYKTTNVYHIEVYPHKNYLAEGFIVHNAGKTFIFAIWDTWQIVTQDRWQITCMGGSSKQSKIIQGYINDWRIDIKMIKVIIHRSLRGIDRYCITVGRSKCDFPACSTTSARGPHVNEVQIDEACEAEDKSEDGAKAVAAVQWQTTGKREGRIQLSSTAHYIHGSFYEYMTKPEYGFIVYRWAIAKHISGEKDPYKTYTDKDPTHWLPNVWWLTQDEIEQKRRSKSDEEWLCEALGGASMASGAVFKKKDLDIIICGMCENCEPYKWGHCKLIEMAGLGTEKNPIKYIIDRRGGFDYGVSDAPCALTILGRKLHFVFVLWNDEQLGLREEEKLDWIDNNMMSFNTWTFIPDPAVAGKHLNEKLEEKGYSIYIIPVDEKTARVYNVINFVEKHKIIIPKAFWYLTQSLRRLAWKNNKIRKIGDHSFDSLQYGMVDFILEGGVNILDEFLKRTENQSKKREGEKTSKPKLSGWSLDALIGEKK